MITFPRARPDPTYPIASAASLSAYRGEEQARAGIQGRTGSEHVLLRVVGGAPDVGVDLTEIPVQPGDYLLLCSDGLTRMFPMPRWRRRSSVSAIRRRSAIT